MAKTNPSYTARERRRKSIRKKIRGTPERPRLSIFRSANHIYAQIIDDTQGLTLVAASTLSPELKEMDGHSGNVSAAKKVGALLAERAKTAGVEKVVFDRGGFLYHGRVKALADSAREAGLNF